MRMSLSWTLESLFKTQGGNSLAPQWDDVEVRLLAITCRAGCVTLDLADASQRRPRSLQVRAEGGRFLLTLGVEDDEYRVRSFTNIAAQPEKVQILGDLWDARMICTDINVVVVAFKQFFETGDVSQALLD